MLTEDYCDFETAKLLKVKGFDIPCDYAYNNKAGYFEVDRSNFDEVYCFRPSLAMAMKWLREVHKISIEITSTGHFIDNDVEWECDIKAGHRLYFRHITNEKSFESCAEKAIKYCLEHLI